MPVMAWVAIAVAINGVVFTVVFWLIQRHVTRIDQLSTAVFGDNGVHVRLHKYVTHDVLEAKVSQLRGDMRGIHEEGQRREERILSAIKEQSVFMASAVGEIKTDLRAQGSRIDEVMNRAHHNQR